MPKNNIEIRSNPTACADCQIRKLALFDAVPDRYMEQAQEKRKSQFRIKAKSTIYSEDDACANAFTVFEGWVLLYRAHSNGTIQGLRIALPGDFIGFMPVSEDYYHHSAMTISDSVLCCFKQQGLHEMIDTQPGLAAKIHAMHSEYMANCQNTLLGLGRKTAEQRIAHLIADVYHRLVVRKMVDTESGEMPFPMTQEMLGDMTGLTPVHVNRVMRKLREDKVFEPTRSSLKRINIEKLIEIGEYKKPSKYAL